jgi:magnesium transporter
MLQRPTSAATEIGVVASSVYAEGKHVADLSVDEVGSWSRRPGHVVWIGLFEPSHDLLNRVGNQLELHPLAIEDAGKAHQHPKIEQYGNSLFIVVRTAQMAEGQIAFGETHLFVGSGYVVSVRHGASASYTAVRERCESCPTVFAHGEDYILYAILDFVVDNYAPVLAEINKEVDVIEERIFRRKTMSEYSVDRLYTLRRELLRLRNAVTPLLEVCQRLEHAEVRPIDAAMRPHFRDVTDHVSRLKEEIDTLREVLAFAFEAGLMRGQMAQTEITRRLAAWAAILAVPTAVAGIYGMNFEYMPELKWRYGYFMVVGGIAAVCIALYALFRRHRWL